MVYGRGFDSRRLHQFPQVASFEAADRALLHSALASIPVAARPPVLGVSAGVSAAQWQADWGYRVTRNASRRGPMASSSIAKLSVLVNVKSRKSLRSIDMRGAIGLRAINKLTELVCWQAPRKAHALSEVVGRRRAVSNRHTRWYAGLAAQVPPERKRTSLRDWHLNAPTSDRA